MDALKDQDAKVRSNAAESLGFFPNESKRSIPVLLERLSDTSADVRRAAIQALGRIGRGTDSVKPALQKFASDPDPLIKLNALVALAGVGHLDDSTIPVLTSALGNKDEMTAKAAGRVLGGMAAETPDKVLPGLLELLDRKEQPSTGNALRVLRQMKTQAVPALQKIAALYDKAEPMDRIEIVDALVAIDTHGDHALPVLIKALKEPDPQDRKEALMSVLRFRSKADEFLGPLSDSLSDSDLENRLLTIGIIKGLGEKGVKAVPKLIVLIDDPDLRVRNAAISALGAFPPEPNIFQALDKAMKDRDSRVRMTAIGILRRIGTADPQKASVILEQALAAETNDQTKRSISSALDSLKKPQPRASDHMK